MVGQVNTGLIRAAPSRLPRRHPMMTRHRQAAGPRSCPAGWTARKVCDETTHPRLRPALLMTSALGVAHARTSCRRRRALPTSASGASLPCPTRLKAMTTAVRRWTPRTWRGASRRGPPHAYATASGYRPWTSRLAGHHELRLSWPRAIFNYLRVLLGGCRACRSTCRIPLVRACDELRAPPGRRS